MWEKPIALSKVRERPTVEWQSTWEKTTIAKIDFSGVGSLDTREAGQNSAFASARGPEQAQPFARLQLDANINGEGTPGFDYVRIKHYCYVFARSDESARAAAVPSAGTLPVQV